MAAGPQARAKLLHGAQIAEPKAKRERGQRERSKEACETRRPTHAPLRHGLGSFASRLVFRCAVEQQLPPGQSRKLISAQAIL